jgi:predicted dehydrogenase
MKILIVGCGSIGKRHAENAAKLAETAVVDVDEDKAINCGEKLGIQSFPDLESALEWRPSGVVVAAPSSLHIQIALTAIEAGAHVLVEKPLSISQKGVRAFLDRSEILKRKVFVVCNMRFHPAVSMLHQHLHRIGQPYFARAHYGNYLPDMRSQVNYRELYCAHKNMGGGVVLDGIHELDYLAWFFGPVSKILCHAEKLSGLDIDAEDYASILLRHINGVASEIHLDYLRPFKRRGCEIVGAKGILIWQSEGKNPEKCNVRFYDKNREVWESLFVSENLDANEPYEKLMEYFIKAIRGQDVPLLKGRQAAEELSIALKALDISAQAGSDLKVPKS